jgi:hypothetical protein
MSIKFIDKISTELPPTHQILLDFHKWYERIIRAPIVSYVREGFNNPLEMLANLVPLYQVNRSNVEEKRRGIFIRWKIKSGLWVWGTATRWWGIRIVGPVEEGANPTAYKVGFPFYYSIHKESGSVLTNGWAISLMQAKRVAVMHALDIPYGTRLTWSDMKEMIKREHQAMRDEAALTALKGEEVSEVQL